MTEYKDFYKINAQFVVNQEKTLFLVWNCNEMIKKFESTEYFEILAFTPQEAIEIYSESIHLYGFAKLAVTIKGNYEYPTKFFQVESKEIIIYNSKEIDMSDKKSDKEKEDNKKTAGELYEFYRYVLGFSHEDALKMIQRDVDKTFIPK